VILGFLNTRLGKALLAIIAALAVVLGLVQYGKLDERQEAVIREMEVQIETMERIDNVEDSPTRDAAIERMRKHGLVR
jgi:hypothetical protein